MGAEGGPGARLPRHSMAANMLRQGGCLPEIGEILRLRLPSTTEIYAGLDTRALRTVAQPCMAPDRRSLPAPLPDIPGGSNRLRIRT